jgi:hypothetical protein
VANVGFAQRERGHAAGRWLRQSEDWLPLLADEECLRRRLNYHL